MSTILFIDMQDNETAERTRIQNRLLALQDIAMRRTLTPMEIAEQMRLTQLQAITDQSLDPLFVGARDLFRPIFLLNGSTTNPDLFGEGAPPPPALGAGFITTTVVVGEGDSPTAQNPETDFTSNGWPNVVRFAAIYGILSTDGATPPAVMISPAGSVSTGSVLTGSPPAGSVPTGSVPTGSVTSNPSDPAYASFNSAFFGAVGEINGSLPLALRVFPILLQEGQQPPIGNGGAVIDQIRAAEFARVLRNLVRRGITVGEEQLRRRVNEALDSIQNIGDSLPPSQIGIDLPELEDQTDYQIVADNIRAMQPIYFSAMLEELKVFQVVDKLVELFQNGILAIGRGNAGNFLYRYWKEAPNRISEAERRNFYARCLGLPGGDDGGMPNREFHDLMMRFMSAVSSFVRQNNIDNLLRAAIPAAVTQEAVRKSGRDLAANITLHGYGMTYFAATELQKQIKDVIGLLSDPDIKGAYGARDMWQVVDQVATLELGGAKNSVRYRTMATAGAIIMAWLAKNAKSLAATGIGPVLDVDMIRSPVPNPQKPTTNPTDYDLVNACEQWLAVTGTEEEQVEQFAQPKETPVITGKPIQIPSVARDALEAAGIALPTGMGLGLPPNVGAPNGHRRHPRHI
jgi:hypothetical protein